MAEIVEYELRVGRAAMDYWDAFLERLAEARGAVAAVVGADVDEIAMTIPPRPR
jgi:selenocysteine lyase/cysteine desulfurase